MDKVKPQNLLANIPDGMIPMVLASMAQKRIKEDPNAKVCLVYVARDGERLLNMGKTLKQIMPSFPIHIFPSWDCLPYDRVSPNIVSLGARMSALVALSQAKEKGAIILTTTNALIQKIVPLDIVREMSFATIAGDVVNSQDMLSWAADNGYLRVPTVREPSEYAVRGGLIDIFPPSEKMPLRFDFFGSILESIRFFNPDTQRTVGTLKSFNLVPMSEIVLNEKTIKNFRRNYTSNFGGNTVNDPLYGAISAGQRYTGMEHWLPFFYNSLDSFNSYCDDAPFIFDDQLSLAYKERKEQIIDYYEAREQAKAAVEENSETAVGAPYNAIKPELLYEVNYECHQLVKNAQIFQLSPFAATPDIKNAKDMGGSIAPTFAAEREKANSNIFESVINLINAQQKQGKKIILTCWSKGTRDRLKQVLVDHGLEKIHLCANWNEAIKVPNSSVSMVVLEIESGFKTKEMTVLSEADILGARILRPQRKRKASDALTQASSLNAGDLVVHIDHGIGRFIGLKAIQAAGAPHDCVEIEYSRGDKLFLPVENIELLSRYGSSESGGVLDKLGGVAWQAKKSKLKKRIRDMAEQLIRVAAAREMSKTKPLILPQGAYDEFVARFAFDETQDQLVAIDAVLDDLTSGRVMDRLVCGDVGFGKTEIALRAAFAMAVEGRQVALVVPTTLLARQHYKTFTQRFAGLPINIAQASRLVPSAKLKLTKQGLANGSVDIVIGTHALLAKTIEFRDLGLLIIDEEQHFGVGHKERLKELKDNVHVLTLTATPIPRTLQLALTGVRDLSLLATPPVDRLAIRSFVTPFDPLTVREALLREKYRGGQAFYVVPRIKDQKQIGEFLKEQVPEISFMIANGQMPPGDLDDIMNAFYDGKFDVLVATTIVESGLDIPNANTLIVHRADNFGLSQLYQIRGRIGRSKTRAYALFTVPSERIITKTAQRRLEVLQSLESLGAGFQLASHDLDIRGAGNLLGDEQSGHIKEVGFELYQAMLEDAVKALRAGQSSLDETGQWSPQISLGMPVMIPENYVIDLSIRMQLYRRLGDLIKAEEIDEFGAELIDRFGALPQEVQSLLKVVLVKSLCRIANVEKIDAGPKGAIIALRNNEFPNPEGLIKLVSDPTQLVRIKPDQKLVFSRNWAKPEDRLIGTAAILSKLVKLVEKK
jgi:transcription-repair coupling factor (superfamily II helicase)